MRSKLIENVKQMGRRKTINVRAAKTHGTDYTSHGVEDDWYTRAPPDDEYRERAEKMRWEGVDAHVGYWSTEGYNGNWYGVKVDPIPPSQFATNFPARGGVWHVTLGKTNWLGPQQDKQLKRLQARFSTPQRMSLHLGRSNDRGHAPLYHTDPLANDPLVNDLNIMGRPLHVSM